MLGDRAATQEEMRECAEQEAAHAVIAWHFRDALGGPPVNMWVSTRSLGAVGAEGNVQAANPLRKGAEHCTESALWAAMLAFAAHRALNDLTEARDVMWAIKDMEQVHARAHMLCRVRSRITAQWEHNIERTVDAALNEATALVTDHRGTIQRLAAALLATPVRKDRHTLARASLRAAIEAANTTEARAPVLD